MMRAAVVVLVVRASSSSPARAPCTSCGLPQLPPRESGKTVATRRAGVFVNLALALLDDENHSAGGAVPWAVRAFKRPTPGEGKWGVSCRATYALEVRAEACCASAENNNITLKSTTLLFPAVPSRRCVNVRSWRSNGPEDARLVALPRGDGLALMFNDFALPDATTLSEAGHGGYRRTQFLSRVEISPRPGAGVSVSRPVLVSGGGHHFGSQEKNWSPWATADGRLMAHQWLVDAEGRSVVLEIESVDEGRVATQAHACGAADLRRVVTAPTIAGGTNAVSLNDTHMLALGHTFHETSRYRIYAMFAYLFEATSPFCIVAATPEFHLAPPQGGDSAWSDGVLPPPKTPDYGHIAGTSLAGNKAVQFPMSIAVLDDEPSAESRRRLLLSWGYADRESMLSAIDLDSFLRDHLRPLQRDLLRRDTPPSRAA